MPNLTKVVALAALASSTLAVKDYRDRLRGEPGVLESGTKACTEACAAVVEKAKGMFAPASGGVASSEQSSADNSSATADDKKRKRSVSPSGEQSCGNDPARDTGANDSSPIICPSLDDFIRNYDEAASVVRQQYDLVPSKKTRALIEDHLYWMRVEMKRKDQYPNNDDYNAVLQQVVDDLGTVKRA